MGENRPHSPAATVRKQQRLWATAAGLEIDDAGYTLNLDDNLFVPLSSASLSEFSGGDGGELGAAGQRGKMQALHSSSALACNVFEYWRVRNAAALSAALALPKQIVSLGFEHKFPTGLRGNPPNLDVVLRMENRYIVAVESKFLEPYGSRHGGGFKSKYFDRVIGLWAEHGFDHCQKIALRLYSGEAVFDWLHAEQLLKHILGLAKSGAEWCLYYLWYKVAGSAGSEHGEEVDMFAHIAANDGIDFKSMSYQALFERLVANCTEFDAAYLRYLGKRYFDESG